MKYQFAMRDGDRIAVLRPDDPQLALRLAQEALDEQEDKSPEERERQFQAILEAQPYRFVGCMATTGKPHPKLLDANGWPVGHVRPGDSFTPWQQVVDAGRKSVEADMVKWIKKPDGTVTPGNVPDVGPTLVMRVQEDGSLLPHVEPSKEEED